MGAFDTLKNALQEVRFPWQRCAHVLLRSGHSGCMANHADLVVNGNFVEPSMMSDTEVVQCCYPEC